MIKFASYMMLSDYQSKWIMRNLENTHPHVDNIYLAYSKFPWSYNSEARTTYTNEVDLDSIQNSKYADKITIIEGDWPTDGEQRNACLEQAKKDKIDFLIAQDTDEFIFHDDYEKLKWLINSNPNYDAYNLPHYDFWKSFNYILMHHNTGRNAGLGQKIINVHTTQLYDYYLNTHPNKSAALMEIYYYHGAYVLSNEEVYRKIKTWGHTNDFDVDKWYNEVWLNWTLESKNLHPIWPEVWTHCEEFLDPLPEVITDIR
jgi:hypothetical protein